MADAARVSRSVARRVVLPIRHDATWAMHGPTHDPIAGTAVRAIVVRHGKTKVSTYVLMRQNAK